MIRKPMPTQEQWEQFHQMGDVNRDGYINQTDLDLIYAAFNSVPGSGNWNPDADLNNDSIVNMADVTICTTNFGTNIWDTFPELAYNFNVTDANTTLPVEGALIRLICTFPPGGTIPFDATTNSSGFAQIVVSADFPPVSYTVSKTGYEPYSAQAPIPIGNTVHLTPVFTLPIPDSGQGTLHANQTGARVNVMASYPEGSPEFNYILSLVGAWNYDTSNHVTVPETTSSVTINCTDMDGNPVGGGQNSGSVIAYIYGHMPGSPDYTPNSCTAFVVFPTVAVTATASGNAAITASYTGNINFSAAGDLAYTIEWPPDYTMLGIVTAGAVAVGAAYYFKKRRK